MTSAKAAALIPAPSPIVGEREHPVLPETMPRTAMVPWKGFEEA